MESILITVHYLICFFLIVVILLQAGKGADIGAVFGGASQTMFGSRGPATFLNKATVFVAMGFLVTSIWLAHLAKQRSGTSILDKAPITETARPAKQEVPFGAPADTKETAPTEKQTEEKSN
ncbi:MAG: preprotein translocase subunit SecG [Pseudomonadota bacterium]